MNRVAVVRVDGVWVLIHVAPGLLPPALSRTFSELHAVPRGYGTWMLEPEMLEPLCSALDRLGIVWGLSTPDDPRTWAERLFAETPPELHEKLYASLRPVLVNEPDHQAVLDYAWAARGGAGGL